MMLNHHHGLHFGSAQPPPVASCWLIHTAIRRSAEVKICGWKGGGRIWKMTWLLVGCLGWLGWVGLGWLFGFCWLMCVCVSLFCLCWKLASLSFRRTVICSIVFCQRRKRVDRVNWPNPRWKDIHGIFREAKTPFFPECGFCFKPIGSGGWMVRIFTYMNGLNFGKCFQSRGASGNVLI